MDRFPVLWNGASAGELTAEREGLYTCFHVRCHPPENGVWCAWAVGEQGELRLGVLEPSGGAFVLRRRFSDHMTVPAGRLLRGELRPAGQPVSRWEPIAEPEQLFSAAWLRRSMHGLSDVMTCTEGTVRCLALPYDPKKPFPLTELFCFARLRYLGEKAYIEFRFDEKDWPVFG